MKSLLPLLLLIFLSVGCDDLVEQLNTIVEEHERAPGLDWISNRDLTSAQFSEKFNSYSDRGYRMIDVDAYPTNDGVRYAMIWIKNTDNRRWAEYRDMSSTEYHDKWTELGDQGMRPIDVEMYRKNGNWKYAGIWEENVENYQWLSNRNLTGDQYGTQFQERSDDGYRLIDMEAHDTPDGLRYAAIWVENREGLSWSQLRNMDRDEYQQELDSRVANGFRVLDFECYLAGGQERYAVIWVENPNGRLSAVRSGRNATGFANYWRQYRDEGMRLVDFERYDTPSGSRYAGVWLENEPRMRWEHRAAVDQAVEGHLANANLMAISAVVMHDGEIRYRRGFGWADEDAGKTAHAESVYSLASVSKTIGATLAVKLEDEGRLADGTSVSLNLDNTTRSYIPLPGNGHTHTVEQLIAHLGCIEHYQNPRNEPSGHFSTAAAASAAINNRGIVSNCTIGTQRSYSTHAYTHLGAVLEEVTDRPITRLVEEEISDPYNLPSIRAMYRTSSLPANYERVRPYNSGGSEISYSDNSWKVLGGGLEGNLVDLARFARKIETGDILRPAARDDMWTRVAPSASNTYAIGWDTNTSPNYVDHGGDGTGTRTYLRVYRIDGEQLIIALAATRKTSAINLPGLANQIEAIVLP